MSAFSHACFQPIGAQQDSGQTSDEIKVCFVSYEFLAFSLFEGFQI